MIHTSLIYRDQFGTEAMRKVWTETAMMQRWLDMEAAASWAQGELGIVPKDVATEIMRNCNTEVVSPEAVAAWYRRTGHVIVSLVKAFRDAVPEAGERFHLGLTTQDVLDTGLTLQIRDALQCLIPMLFEFEDILLDLADAHCNTVMVGRSEGQHGAPITFGYKIAVMASEIGAHLERLRDCSGRLMILTMFGAMGVQSSYCQVLGKEHVGKFLRLTGSRLDLAVPEICPHHRTDRFAELGHVLALICSSVGEMGMEVRDLQRSEVGEVAEPWRSEQFSSSTLPQKQNPEMSEWWEGLARLSRGFSASLTEIHQQHERDISRLAPELHALPNLFLGASAVVAHATRIFSGLQVFENRMWDNLTGRGALAMAEPIMLALAEKSERKVWAHQLVHDIAIEVSERRGHFGDAILKHPEVRKYLEPEALRQLLDPAQYIGTAVEQVQATRSQARSRRNQLEKDFAKAFDPFAEAAAPA